MIFMGFRRQLIEILTTEPRTASSVARELGLDRREIEADLPHLIRSARAAGHRVVVDPARCRACGYLFDTGKLNKPGRCPACRGTWLFEPRISVER